MSYYEIKGKIFIKKCNETLFVIYLKRYLILPSHFEIANCRKGNITEDEFTNGDFMVSPFAKWSVKLGLCQGNVPLNYFQQFKNKVNLILDIKKKKIKQYVIRKKKL